MADSCIVTIKMSSLTDFTKFHFC